ncbi:barstar family protein [Paenibacillus sp. QZ-Y1]|uniref:barstar family protein n=1 Tax=Paenibacillus sp. QZ-Y1 TaxID=3414511 RepID=UPI003F79769C
MNKIMIRGKEITSVEEMQCILQKETGLDSSHFKDLDALREGIMWHTVMPITLEWVNFNESRYALGAYADQLMNVLYEVDEQLEELFTLILK